MRHRKNFNHLSRTSSHRKAMLSNMAASLILHKRIHTTLAKAKALRTYIEPLITKSKEDTTHSRRVVFSYLQSKEAVTELFREVSLKVADRPGGYTRIIKLPNRLGDNAEMCMMELVDYNENLLGDKAGKAKATRKRRSTGKKKAEDNVLAPVVVAAEVVDEVVTEEPEADVTAEVVAAEVAEEVVAEEAVAEVAEEAVVEEVVEEVVAETEAVVDETIPEAQVEDTPAEEEKKDDSKQESK